MTAFEQWLKESVEKLIPDPSHAAGCPTIADDESDEVLADYQECACGMVPSTLEQRLAIGLVQARALELRTMATEMQLKNLNQTPPGAWLFQRLWDRSHKLEQIGLKLCESYPPSDAAPSEEEIAGPRLVQ